MQKQTQNRSKSAMSKNCKVIWKKGVSHTTNVIKKFHIHYSLPTKRVKYLYAINIRPVWLLGASTVQREWSDWLSSFSVQQGINFILDRQIWPSFYPFYSPVCLKKGWYLYHAKNECQHWVLPRKWLVYSYLQDLVAIYRYMGYFWPSFHPLFAPGVSQKGSKFEVCLD